MYCVVCFHPYKLSGSMQMRDGFVYGRGKKERKGLGGLTQKVPVNWTRLQKAWDGEEQSLSVCCL